MIKLIKPIGNVVVPVPEYNSIALPIEGLELPLSSYWYRRLEEGVISVEDVTPVDKKSKKES